MIRFISFMAVATSLILTSPAQAQCGPSKAWLNFAVEYNDWREHRKERMNKHKKRWRHCGERKRHHRGHRLPPELPNPCVVCVGQVQPKPAKPKSRPADAGFCKVEQGEYRSRPFELEGITHLLSVVILKNELNIELIRYNTTDDISDDDRYVARPEGFSTPAKSATIPLASFPEKARDYSNQQTCNTTRSLIWNDHTGAVNPEYFQGQINMLYAKDTIYTQTFLVTDRVSTSLLDIPLKKRAAKKFGAME